MRLYPQAPRALARVIAGDLVILGLLATFAWLGVTVHDRVGELTTIARGVEQAGGDVRGSLQSAADRLGSLPFVGDQLADGLRQAASGLGGSAIELGRDGQESVRALATTLGWLTFIIPAVLLLVPWVPRRAERAARLTAAARLLGPLPASAQRAALAHRAAYSLSYATLARHTRDPFGDLQRGDYDALIAAAYEDAGLRPAHRQSAGARSVD
jgi:hypothetical protein